MTMFSQASHQDNNFRPDLALSLLAISLFFSSITIITIYSSGNFFIYPMHLIVLGVFFLITARILFRTQAINLRQRRLSIVRVYDLDKN